DQTEWDFDATGLLTRVLDTNSQALTYNYDSSSRLSAVNFPDGTTTSVTYMLNGSNHQTQITEPGNHLVTVTTDSSNRLIGIKNPDNGLVTFSYDGANRVTNVQWGPLNTTISYDTATSAIYSVDEGLGSIWTFKPGLLEGLVTNPAVNASMQGVSTFSD